VKRCLSSQPTPYLDRERFNTPPGAGLLCTCTHCKRRSFASPKGDKMAFHLHDQNSDDINVVCRKLTNIMTCSSSVKIIQDLSLKEKGLMSAEF
jgi:hypothetical protein